MTSHDCQCEELKMENIQLRGKIQVMERVLDSYKTKPAYDQLDFLSLERNTSKRIASAVSRVLRDPKSSKAVKTAAGLTLTQRTQKERIKVEER